MRMTPSVPPVTPHAASGESTAAAISPPLVVVGATASALKISNPESLAPLPAQTAPSVFPSSDVAR